MSAAVTEDTLTRQLWHIAGGGDLEQLDELIGQGVDVNAADRTGVTALMRAAYHGQLAMVRALIGYGADPGARDRSGLTALMMADHGGHDEIVEALGRFGAQDKTAVVKKHDTGVSPVNHAQDARATPTLNQSVTEADVDFATDYEDSTTGETSQTARTLHQPPEIWEMVQTTQTQPFSPSVRPGRIFSRRILVLAAAALIICSGAVFGFLALRGAGATEDAPQQQSKATAPERTSSANERLPASKSAGKAGKIARSSNELTNLKPVEELTGERVDQPNVASSVPSAKKALASQRPKAAKVSAAFPKSNKSVRGAVKLESEDTTAKSAKKVPAPPASDPVKPSTTQKPKVIQWP